MRNEAAGNRIHSGLLAAASRRLLDVKAAVAVRRDAGSSGVHESAPRGRGHVPRGAGLRHRAVHRYPSAPCITDSVSLPRLALRARQQYVAARGADRVDRDARETVVEIVGVEI